MEPLPRPAPELREPPGRLRTGALPASDRLLLLAAASDWVLLLLCLIPVFLAANFIWRFGVDVPEWDQWELVPLLRSLRSGHLTVQEIFAQHNEHRILFPRVLMLVLATLTRWDTRAEMWLGWGLLVGLGIALALEHRRAFGWTREARWLFAPVPWLVFTLNQSHNLLWGWQMQIFLAAASCVWSLVCLERGGWAWLSLAALLGLVSSQSFAAGLCVWPAGLVLLALERVDRRQRYLRLASWVGCAVVAVGLYFHGYAQPQYHPDTAAAVKHPGLALRFFAAGMGSSLGGPSEGRLSTAIGLCLIAVLLAALALSRWRALDPSRARFGLALGLFAAFTCALTTIGRLGYASGPDDVTAAIASRYTTLTVLGVVGAYRCALSCRGPLVRAALAGGILSLVLVGTYLALDTQFRSGAVTRRDKRADRATLLNYSHASAADLSKLYPHPDIVRERAEDLRSLRTSVFR
jgi:hypothetical protein